ncbi:MAG: Multi-sensor signal transduction histidine kinase, partial [Dehalococcoidia bacterium]|nr:Multi-sensor signal transduction histidine kinase [Dehalococcoidia bacterium]MBF8304057.1 Multi-sensor signal transduction histidine kinase [Dehalococcoidia bacterium]
EINGEERRLPSEVETTVFRVCQEAITNISKHASAATVLIEINFKPSSLAVVIEDDGQGFNLSSVTATSPLQGFGLLGMRERVNLVGGTLNISTRSGQGTRIVLEVPYSKAVEHG